MLSLQTTITNPHCLIWREYQCLQTHINPDTRQQLKPIFSHNEIQAINIQRDRFIGDITDAKDALFSIYALSPKSK